MSKKLSKTVPIVTYLFLGIKNALMAYLLEACSLITVI